MARIGEAALVFVLLMADDVLNAQQFPVVGATYQLNSARYPEKVAICSSQQAMTKYIEAEAKKDSATTRRMLFEIETSKDFARMKNAGGCTLISSSSQATILEKGVGAHRAEFMALPFEGMWGYYLYFGGRVR